MSGADGGEESAQEDGSALAPQPQIVAVPVGMQAAQGMPVVFQQVQTWQGPYPPPDALERMEALQPGTLDRLLAMSEKQQDKMFDAASDARVLLQRDTKRGHVLGAIIAGMSIVGAVTCGLHGMTVVACALVGVPVLAVAKALIDSTKSSRETSATAVVAAPAPTQAPPATQEETAVRSEHGEAHNG